MKLSEDSKLISRKIDTGTDGESPIDPAVFLKQANKKIGEEHIFATKPIECNVKGWNEAVSVVALSLEPNSNAVKEIGYYPLSADSVSETWAEGDKHYRNNRIGLAKEQFEKVLKIDPRDFKANFRLAQILLPEGVNRAKNYWQAAKKTRPDHGQVWAFAGVYYLEQFLLASHNDSDETPNRKLLLESAINDFVKAKLLFSNAFDSRSEKHCELLHDICCLIRGKTEEVPDLCSKYLQNEQENGFQSPVTKILYNICYILVMSHTRQNMTEEVSAEDIYGKIQTNKEKLKGYYKYNQNTVQKQQLELLEMFSRLRLMGSGYSFDTDMWSPKVAKEADTST